MVGCPRLYPLPSLNTGLKNILYYDNKKDQSQLKYHPSYKVTFKQLHASIVKQMVDNTFNYVKLRLKNFK